MGALENLGSALTPAIRGYYGGKIQGQQRVQAMKQAQDLMDYRNKSLELQNNYRRDALEQKAREGALKGQVEARKVFKGTYDSMNKALQNPDTLAYLTNNGLLPDFIADIGNLGDYMQGRSDYYKPQFGFNLITGKPEKIDGPTLGPDGRVTDNPLAPPMRPSAGGGGPTPETPGYHALIPDAFKDESRIASPAFPSATPPGFPALGREGTILGNLQPPVQPTLPPGVAGPLPQVGPPRLNADRVAALAAAAGQTPTPGAETLAPPPPPELPPPPQQRQLPYSPKTQSEIDKNTSTIDTNKARKGYYEAQTGNIAFNQDLANRKLDEVRAEGKRRQMRWKADHDEAVRTRQGRERYEGRIASIRAAEVAIRQAMVPSEIALNEAQIAELNAKVEKAKDALSDKDKAILAGVGPIYKEIKGIGGSTVGRQKDPVAAQVYSEMFGANLENAPDMIAGIMTLPGQNENSPPVEKVVSPPSLPPGTSILPGRSGSTPNPGNGARKFKTKADAYKAAKITPTQSSNVIKWIEAGHFDTLLNGKDPKTGRPYLSTPADKQNAQRIKAIYEDQTLR